MRVFVRSLTVVLGVIVGLVASTAALATTNKSKPNILAIWGDDIGFYNLSAINHGMMGYQTPNIDRIANEGALFTDHYVQQSCTAGRAAFMMGQHPVRTGMLTIGMPGSPHGIPDWTPTIADLLKERGYMTGQFGKNHFGDQDNHLPTNHGFDEFFGNLYHLNAEEEPETYYYPKDAEFRKKYGPRGVLHSFADGKINDTGPMTRKRMETAQEEFLNATLKFIDKAHQAKKPFFVWFNSTRMHVWTRLAPKWDGKSGIGLYADGMLEHDWEVGELLDKLDDLKIADNTIVLYSTDNGAETFSWPDGGTTPFHGEKGTTNEGGFRVPQFMRWPGKVKAGTKINGITSHEDWMPTLLAAAGDSNIVAKLKKGHKANGKTFKVHPDGYNLLPYITGKAKESPRDTIFYFSANQELNAVRWNDFKATFATMEGDIATTYRITPNWPVINNLKADPFQKANLESSFYIRWYADNMWLFVPVQQKIRDFVATLDKYPFQPGSSLSAANISVPNMMLEKRLRKLEGKK
ncbi:MAG: arylsulfatase [Candidatus Pelagadaptatus aseana]|uniref:arylsulfatase n=1 Tax=Candidatus Pelagadaptatus aseana TaxID=3120508 RepID=UPI0039B1719E